MRALVLIACVLGLIGCDAPKIGKDQLLGDADGGGGWFRSPDDSPFPRQRELLNGSPVYEANSDRVVDVLHYDRQGALLRRAYTEGSVMVDVESQYIPAVIACEWGLGLNRTAVGAASIIVRSYLYYSLGRSGAIYDGEEAQVYERDCGHSNRVVPGSYVSGTALTDGVILTYKGTRVAAFHVDGNLYETSGGSHTQVPKTEDCYDDPGTLNGRRITFNEGLVGRNIEQSPIGWVHWSNDANRGLASQEGIRCLSVHTSRSMWGIVRFYYGADVVFSCLEHPDRATGCQ